MTILNDTSLFTFKRSTNLNNMSLARKLIQDILMSLSLSPKLQQQIQLCMTEATTNIINHSGASFFQIDFSSQINGWQMVLSDNGVLFDCNFNKDIGSLDIMSEGGRGLALLKHYSDHVHYKHSEGVNRLTLTWHKKSVNRPRLLLVEDENIQREIYLAYLSPHYHVIESKNGEEALDIIKSEVIDLILADINMPKMNGIELLEIINNDDNIAAIPFVFLSALDDEDTLKNVNYLGVDSFITKPIAKDELLINIAQVLARHHKLAHKINLKLDQKISALLTPNITNKIHQFELSYRSYSAQGGGGDFMIEHSLPDGDKLVVIGDVMGHDQQAKYFAHTYASYIRGLLLGLHSSKIKEGNGDTNAENVNFAAIEIDKLMSTLSDFVLKDDVGAKSILTCQFIHFQTNQISIVSAGHPPPLLLTQQGEVQPTTSAGMVLGLLPSQQYEQQNITLKKNERLLFYTDGLFESVAKIEQQKMLEAHILAALALGQHDNIDNAKALICSSFEQVSGLPVKDDTLLLLVGN